MGELKPKATQPSTSAATLSVACYCVSSLLMTLINKVTTLDSEFNMFSFLLFVQSLVCVVVLITLKLFGTIEIRSLNFTDVRKWIFVAIFYAMTMYTSSKALKFLTIPVYTFFKSLSVILIAFTEAIFFRGSITSLELLSYALMIAAALTLGYGDLLNSIEIMKIKLGKNISGRVIINIGYGWMIFNWIATALFVIFMKRQVIKTGFKDYDTIFYNNILAIPIYLVGSLFTENWNLVNRSYHLEADTISLMIISGLVSVTVSYFSVWCIHSSSAKTYSVAGNLNKFPIALLGFLFKNSARNFFIFVGLAVGLLSGIISAVSKTKKIEDAEKVEKLKE